MDSSKEVGLFVLRTWLEQAGTMFGLGLARGQALGLGWLEASDSSSLPIRPRLGAFNLIVIGLRSRLEPQRRPVQ